MNLRDLLERLWRATGYPDTGNSREDGRLQDYKDFINAAQDEIAKTCSPKLFSLTRKSTITLVNGTQNYVLDDWVMRPVSFWTEGSQARPVRFKRARNADLESYRNTAIYSAVFGDYTVTDAERTSDAYASGIAGATTGATSNGTADVTLGSACTLVAAWVGRMFRLNGEQEDYKITAINNTTKVVSLDKVVVPRMSGVDKTGAGTAYAAASCPWEVGPKGRYTLQFLPTPGAADTVYCRAMTIPRKLIGLTDTSDLNQEYHELLWMGALKRIATDKESSESLALYKRQYDEALNDLKKSELDEYVSADPPRYVTMGQNARVVQPGVYIRGMGDW